MERTMKRLAHLVYDKGLRQTIKEYYENKYKSRIEFLVGCNNELMAELEQWERDDVHTQNWERDML